MKKELLIVFGLLFITTSLLAQGPVLSESNLSPYPGFVVTVQELRASGVQDGATGSSKTWDYSSLQDTSFGPVTTDYIDADATPDLSDFPGANVCFRQGGGFIQYQESTDTVFYNLGQADSGQWYIDFSTPEEIWHYPLSYSKFYTSTFGGTENYDGYTDNETGTDTINAVGYGSLKLPGGINLDNVLQVSSIRYYTDVYTGSFQGTYLSIYHDQYYVTPNFRSPVLTIEHEVQYLNSNLHFSVTTVNYATNVSEGINDLNSLINNLNIFPNPSSTQSVISLNLKEASNITVYVTDLLGQKVKTITSAQVDAGLHNYEIAIGDMANGMYLVTVEVNGAIAGVRKLEIE